MTYLKKDSGLPIVRTFFIMGQKIQGTHVAARKQRLGAPYSVLFVFGSITIPKIMILGIVITMTRRPFHHRIIWRFAAMDHQYKSYKRTKSALPIYVQR